MLRMHPQAGQPVYAEQIPRSPGDSSAGVHRTCRLKETRTRVLGFCSRSLTDRCHRDP